MEDAGDEGIYTQDLRRAQGAAGYVIVRPLPPYLALLHEDCYWFQHTDVAADRALLVSKETAIRILRQDVRAAIAAARKGR